MAVTLDLIAGRDRMTKVLSDRQLERYRREGCLFPLPAFLAGEAAAFCAKLGSLEQREGGTPPAPIASRTCCFPG
jgi:hypothetical protein